MALTAPNADSIDPLSAFVGELKALGGRISGKAVAEALARNPVGIDDVASYVAPTPTAYGRRRVARTDAFEVLVMTWLPGQRTGVHDHAGVLSAYKILRGTARETKFAQSSDSLVDPLESIELREGEVGVDDGEVIHEIDNDGPDQELLVSLHVYAPPLSELRRFTRRPAKQTLTEAFRGRRTRPTPTIAIVGGGFSGAMVAAHLARRTAQSGNPLHIVIIDRQTSIAEGAAYRSPDASHLLNIPAGGMSAWPDAPDDFLDWARQRDPAVKTHTFLQRRTYGEYLRATLFKSIAQAGAQLSIEIRREEASSIERQVVRGWRIQCAKSAAVEVDAVVLATGHRPPDDPLARCWSGSRARYIEDPWASMALSSIEPHESVCLLGTGLTAIDVLQSLSRFARSAPVLALSRRGLLPASHSAAALRPIDPRAWLEQLLSAGSALTTRALSRSIRRVVRQAESSGQDWRQIIDGLRPHISRIWLALPPVERSRFIRHAKAFWEVSRHRMAPAVGESVRRAVDDGDFSSAAARLLSGRGALDAVTLSICRRGAPVTESLRFDWIVNCTGPGSGGGSGLPSVLAKLVESGFLEPDALRLGVRSAPDGRALARGRVIDDLVVVGTLRKPDLWESTAVPELRQHAALAAEAILKRLPGAGARHARAPIAARNAVA